MLLNKILIQFGRLYFFVGQVAAEISPLRQNLNYVHLYFWSISIFSRPISIFRSFSIISIIRYTWDFLTMGKNRILALSLYIRIPYFSPHVEFSCWACTYCCHASVCVVGWKDTLDNNGDHFYWGITHCHSTNPVPICHLLVMESIAIHRQGTLAMTGRAHSQRQVAFF